MISFDRSRNVITGNISSLMNAHILPSILLLLLCIQTCDSLLTLGSDQSSVLFFTGTNFTTIGIYIAMPYYRDSTLPFRLVLDFQPWTGSYQSFGICENIARGNYSYYQLTASYTSQWMLQPSCHQLSCGDRLGAYPLLATNGSLSSGFWDTHKCSSNVPQTSCNNTNYAIWSGSVSFNTLLNGCTDRSNNTLFIMEDTPLLTTYSGNLYKTQLSQSKYGALTCGLGYMYYSADPFSSSGLNSSHYVAMGPTVSINGVGAMVSSLITSPDVFEIAQMRTFSTPLVFISAYAVAFKANYVSTVSGINTYNGTIYLYVRSLTTSNTLVTSVTSSLLEYGNILMRFGNTTGTRQVTWEVNFISGNMKPNGFPVNIDLSLGNTYYGQASGLIAGSPVDSLNSYKLYFSMRSNRNSYSTLTQMIPIRIVFDKRSNTMETISPTPKVEYHNQLWYVYSVNSTSYIYTFNMTAKVYVYPGYSGAALSDWVTETKPGTNLTLITTKINCSDSFVDAPSGLNYCLQDLYMSSGVTFGGATSMLGNYRFNASVGQCSTKPNSTLPITGQVCGEYKSYSAPVIPVNTIMAPPPTLNIGLPMKFYIGPTGYNHTLQTQIYQLVWQWGQRAYAAVTMDPAYITSKNQYKVTIKDAWVCTPNVQDKQITYDGVLNFGCNTAMYSLGSPLFLSYRLINNFVANTADFGGSTNFNPEYISAPNYASAPNDYRVSGFSFYVYPMTFETRIWYIHLTLNISTVGGTALRKRVGDVIDSEAVSFWQGNAFGSIIVKKKDKTLYEDPQVIHGDRLNEEKTLPLQLKDAMNEALEISTLTITSAVAVFASLLLYKLLKKKISAEELERRERRQVSYKYSPIH